MTVDDRPRLRPGPVAPRHAAQDLLDSMTGLGAERYPEWEYWLWDDPFGSQLRTYAEQVGWWWTRGESGLVAVPLEEWRERYEAWKRVPKKRPVNY